MLIRSTLFDKGYMTGQAGLSEVLGEHERQTLNKIRQISSLDEMTDAFLSRLIKDSLVEPPAVDFDRKSRQLRTEELDASLFPSDFRMYAGTRYPKQVARISIPFTGDPQLLRFTPNQASFSYPQGQVNGKTIQFDIILWGYQDDDKRVKNELDNNIQLLKMYADNASIQVKAFNEAIPGKVKSAFDVKLEELTKQHSIFDSLGIVEEKPTPPPLPSGPPSPQHEKRPRRVPEIVLYIENQYVQQINQMNNNTGNVNNAIQSDE